MTNIYQAYLNLNPADLKRIRDMFFAEFGVAESTLQNFLQEVAQPKNKYVKFFSVLFDLKENLSPIVMAAPLSREYRPFEFKDFKSAAKVKVDKIFGKTSTETPKVEVKTKVVIRTTQNDVTEAKVGVGLRDQARRNQAKARQERIAQRQQQAEHDAQYR